MAIDIGGDYITSSLATSGGYTYFWKYNPANATGTLTNIKVSIVADGVVALKVGTASPASAPNFTKRGSATIGDLSSGDQEITGLSIDVVTGDYIGFYNTGGGGTPGLYYSYAASETAGFDHTYYYNGDGFDGNSHEYTYDGTYFYIFGLGGTGTETAVGQPLIKRLGGVQYAALNRGVF